MPILTTLQAKYNSAMGRAASVIGEAVRQYRPANPMAPLDGSGYTNSFNAAFDADPALSFNKPAVVGRYLFYLLADATTLAVGDYIAAPQSTYFVGSMEDLRPPVVLRTNAVLSLVRPEESVRAGLAPPGGDSLSSEVTLFAGWPSAMLIAGGGGHGDVDLPGDAGMGSWQILLPALFGIAIRGSDILVDQTGLRHVVTAAELSPMGWRIDAQQEAA